MKSGPVRVWASDLSPFARKLRAMLDAVGLAHRWLPAEGTRGESLRLLLRIRIARARRRIVRHPRTQPLDEYPLVPFLEAEDGALLYDSSALAHWIDETHPGPDGPLWPADPGLRFLAQLIDEAFDELGLYMVHHQRWVTSAATNRAGQRLLEEFRPFLGASLAGLQAARFPARQTRRLPYLFSVAPAGGGGGPAGPFPSPDSFPPTHALLDDAWCDHVRAVDRVLAVQPHLLGERFSIADASAYGQLSMNLPDGRAAERLRELSPRTFEWLVGIADGAHVGSAGELRRCAELDGLLELIAETFVPLMVQNEAAYVRLSAGGQTRWNEAAFDRGEALYGGELRGAPFRSVVKTFQVQVWRELRQAWTALAPSERPALPPAAVAALDAG